MWLSRKKKREILKRITACHIISLECIRDSETFGYMTENLADISIELGGAGIVVEGLQQYKIRRTR